MAPKVSPGLEVQLTVIKEMSPVPHTGGSRETIWSWAVISAKGLGCYGLETMRASWGGVGLGQKARQVMEKGLHGEPKQE